jgi:hypothetical protein
MTTSQKSLFIAAMILGNLAYASSLDSFDTSLLTPYVEKAEHAFGIAHETIQWLDHGSREILVTGKPIAKKLYSAQKAILKSIKKELKHTSQRCKNTNPNRYDESHQLYKAFKHLVYKPWKKQVKARYQESKKSNDPHAWGLDTSLKLLLENS